MSRVVKFENPKRYEQYLAFRAMLDSYKVEHGCMQCGYNVHPAALDLDHRDPTEKTNNVGDMYSYTIERVLAELDKCDVLCAICHRIKTFETGAMGSRRDVIYEIVADDDPVLTLFDFAKAAASVVV